MNKALFSSAKMDWETPDEIYRDLDAEFHFDFDPCHKDSVWDGLSIEWGACNYVNPPYGRKIGLWLKKGFEEWQNGKTSVFLIPSRTDTKWWHDYAMKASEIRFIKGRLKFKGAKWSAPFPSCLVIYGNGGGE